VKYNVLLTPCVRSITRKTFWLQFTVFMTRVSNVLEVCRGEKPNNTTGQLKYSMRVTLNTALKTQTLYTKL